jgi:translation initiation factor 3 subunit I
MVFFKKYLTIFLGKVIKSEELHPDPIKSFTIAKDFSLMLTCSTDGAKLLDPTTFELKVFWKTEVPMNTGALSPLISDKENPKYHAIIAGGVMARDAAKHKQGGFEIRLVHVVYGGDELGKIAGHFGPVNALAFYPDGRGFVSGGEEGIIRLFRFDKKYFTDPIFE